MTQPMIVVAGLAVRDGKMLMQLRPQGKLRPGLWEHPGGKVEPGEDRSVALAREWREELSLYHVALPANITLAPTEADDLRWVDPLFAVEHMPCSPGSYLLYPWIRGFVTGDWSLVPSSHRFGASAS